MGYSSQTVFVVVLDTVEVDTVDVLLVLVEVVMGTVEEAVLFALLADMLLG